MKLSILILDDMEDLASSLSEMFIHSGLDSRYAISVSKFRECYKDQKPDIILSDIYMPHGDVTYLLNFLNEEYFNGPLFLMSGGDSAIVKSISNLARGKGQKVVGSYRKPIMLKDVQTMITLAEDNL